MKHFEINSFSEFCAALREAGFSMGGGKPDGGFSLIPFSWNEEPPHPTRVRWHTGDVETDPWEWRVRVLNECEDIGYAKMFRRRSGFVTREWIPYFLAARRGGTTLAEKYREGHVSAEARRIFEVISEGRTLPVEEIKSRGAFGREDKSRFDRALIELQMGLFVTMCGTSQRFTDKGEPFGWKSMLYCTTETFWGAETIAQADEIDTDDAFAQIAERIAELNLEATAKTVAKFVLG